jgi:hypothetical protein
MELTADIINRWFKLGVSATDMTYGQLSIGASLAPLNNRVIPYNGTKTPMRLKVS